MKFKVSICYVIGILFFPINLYGGVLAGVGMHWRNLSFQPLEEEDTPNFFGYGLRLELGYSVWNHIDLKLLGCATPMNKGAAKLFDGDVIVVNYGAGLGFRFVDSVYIGAEYGALSYDTPSHHTHNQTVGTWKGNGMTLQLAGYWQTDRETYFQVGVAASSVRVESASDEAGLERKVDTFMLNVTYLFIGAERSGLPLSVF
ncbi:hypothetical protein [Pseudobacteriovorax antillogorgiicola]|nr:hypothetical protein [Pseudobacteriovorax antillogorgiicola]